MAENIADFKAFQGSQNNYLQQINETNRDLVFNEYPKKYSENNNNRSNGYSLAKGEMVKQNLGIN